MPKPAPASKLIGPSAKPKVRGSGWAYQPGMLELSQEDWIALDSARWFDWLQQAQPFRVVQAYYLVGQASWEPYYLSYTVRPERRQRGQVYWYAYKKYHNRRLQDTYLGLAQAVTLTQLDRLAWQFLAQINPGFYAQAQQVGLVDWRKVPQPTVTSTWTRAET
jgi:hypothetical protein